MAWYWVEKGAAVSGLVALAGVLACLLAQGLQTAEMERLRKEVARLRVECGARGGEEESAQFLAAAGQDVSIVHGSTTNPASARAVPGNAGVQSSRWGGEPVARVERDTRPKPRDRQKWRRSLLHLVPLSISSQGDVTIIHWQKIVHTGKSIEQNHNTISIKGSGYYFIYTQVLYEDQTFVMGHIVKRRVLGSHTGEENLLRCTCNMPKEHPFATCYGAGIYKLQKGDTIELVIPRNSASVSKEKDSTFMGLLKLGPT